MSEGRETDVAPFPVVIVTIDDSGVAVNGEEVERDPDQSPREAAIDAVSRRVARALGRPVRAIAEDYTGRTRLVVHPDGHVSDVATLGGTRGRKPHVPLIERAEYTPAGRSADTRAGERDRRMSTGSPAFPSAPTAGDFGNDDFDDFEDMDDAEEVDETEDVRTTRPANGSPLSSFAWRSTPPPEHVEDDPDDDEDIYDAEVVPDEPADPDPAAEVAADPTDEAVDEPAEKATSEEAGDEPAATTADPSNPWSHEDDEDPYADLDTDPGTSAGSGPIENPWITAATVVNGGPGSDTDRHRARRKSFIAAQPLVGPAQMGPRGVLTRMGMRTHPSRREMDQRESVRKVSQHWPGPRTIAIANPKGSANKTPTMICLSAIFGRYGGAGVLGWDNNETRGTAAWRTHRGTHESTVIDLLPHCSELLGPRAQAAQLAHYVHHQALDKYDVLWSDQTTESEHEMTGAEVDRIHEVAAKYYRLIIMDSGNSERASNWRAMINHADQLVVPCTNVEDTAEAGARMLEALAQRDEHSAALAKTAVAVVSQRTPGKDPNMDRIVRDFAPLVRDVVAIPHDPGLYSGVINFDALHPRTRRAWLEAAASVAINL